MLRRHHKILACFAGLSLIAAACGDDDDGDAADDTTSSTSADATDTTEAGYQLDEPVRLVALISDPGGNDQNAVPDFNDGIRLAVERVNAAGGIGGHPVELEVIETLPTGDTVVNSLNLALEADPTVLLGPVSSTAVLAMAERVDAAGVPMIHNTTEPQAQLSGDAGSPWIFGNRPPNSDAAAVGARYAVEELGAETLGLLHVNTSFGETGAEAQKAAIEDLGAEVGDERAFEFDATDLTEAALAMDGADAILDWGTPGTVGLAVTALAQQGLRDIPHIGPGSVGFGFFTSIVGDESLVEGVYGVIDCNPVGDDREHVQDFVTAFEDEFGYPPSYASAEMYDAVLLVKHVIDDAQSADAQAIADGLTALDGFSDGITCPGEYTNIDNVLHNESVVARYEDGQLATLESYSFG